MEDAGVANPESGLVYEDLIPLSWRQLATDPDPAEFPGIHQSNEWVVRCLSAIDDSRPESGDEEGGSLAHDIARIDFKLNLVLDMVGRLLRMHDPAPEAAPVRISATGIQWRASRAPDGGSPVRIELFLNRNFPSPIVLHGRVVAVTLTDEGDRWVDVNFGDLGVPMRNWLEKLIFRQHRRQIAQTRRALRERGE